MSFTITLKKNLSEDRCIPKQFDSTTLQLTGTLREECDILSPVVVIESSTAPIDFNYMSIPSFGREYYITRIESIRNNLWRISGQVDVLETYKDRILATSALIKRRKVSGNMYVTDSIMWQTARTRCSHQEFKDVSNGNQFAFPTVQNPYILTMMGSSYSIQPIIDSKSPAPESEPEETERAAESEEKDGVREYSQSAG